MGWDQIPKFRKVGFLVQIGLCLYFLFSWPPLLRPSITDGLMGLAPYHLACGGTKVWLYHLSRCKLGLLTSCRVPEKLMRQS